MWIIRAVRDLLYFFPVTLKLLGTVNCSYITNNCSANLLIIKNLIRMLNKNLQYYFSRCINKQEAITSNLFPVQCDQLIDHTEVFLFLPEESYQTILQNFAFLELASLSSPFCDEVGRTYICNYIYPPCEANMPLGVCPNECEKFLVTENPCTNDFRSLAALRVQNFMFDMDCSNSTAYILDTGVSVNFSMECVNITSKCIGDYDFIA